FGSGSWPPGARPAPASPRETDGTRPRRARAPLPYGHARTAARRRRGHARRRAPLLEDGPSRRGFDELGVLAQHALGERRRQGPPALPTAFQLGRLDKQVECSGGHVQADAVAVLYERDRAAV